MDKITQFTGTKFWLSNFWITPIIAKDATYKSVEHAYQALKTDDPTWRQRIMDAKMPADARRIGRCIPKDLIRPEWDNVRLEVMRILVKRKFKHPALLKLLLDTGEAEIIHDNTWNDTFYGVCRGTGENHLGKILMDIRAKARVELSKADQANSEPIVTPMEPPKAEEPKTAVKASRRHSEPMKYEPEHLPNQVGMSLLDAAQALQGR